MDVSPELLAAKEGLAQALEQALAWLPGVLAVDVGLREVGPELTDDLVIRVFVQEAQDIPPGLAELVALTEFPVQVVQRDFSRLVDDAPYDPVIGGISISAAHGPALIEAGTGTLGGVATDTHFQGAPVGVTAAHVIAASDQEVHQGDPVFQPNGGGRQVGRLFRWSDTTDIAVCSLDTAAEKSITEIGPYSSMAQAKIGDRVLKRGRTTGLTQGRVSGVGLQTLGVGTPPHSFEVWSNSAQPSAFCDAGDSGSLIVKEDTLEVVGLLTQAGLPAGRFTTWGWPPSGSISGFAVQMTAAAAEAGVAF